MRSTNLRILAILLCIVVTTIGFAFSENQNTDQQPQSNNNTSTKAFDQMMQVLTHKRCVNCHPAGDRPLQGEDSHIHNFNVQRGLSNHGEDALACSTCHHEENNNISGVPGAPEWHLAPRKMAWEGLNRVEIARSMMNPENNGGRTLEETVKHLTEHELVLWAWEPGVDSEGNPREKPPVSKEDFIAAVKEWAANGAVIPEE
ncbi:MAG: hypothetical protein AB8F74_07970 [Saprospiraceae bacterium]